MGWDQAVAVACTELKIPFVAAIPCYNQDRVWRPADQIRYKSLVLLAKRKVVLSKVYTPTCMQNRNKWMVDNGDKGISLYNGDRFGGTFKCVKYAKHKEKEVINVWEKWLLFNA